MLFYHCCPRPQGGHSVTDPIAVGTSLEQVAFKGVLREWGESSAQKTDPVNAEVNSLVRRGCKKLTFRLKNGEETAVSIMLFEKKSCLSSFLSFYFKKYIIHLHLHQRVYWEVQLTLEQLGSQWCWPSAQWKYTYNTVDPLYRWFLCIWGSRTCG